MKLSEVALRPGDTFFIQDKSQMFTYRVVERGFKGCQSDGAPIAVTYARKVNPSGLSKQRFVFFDDNANLTSYYMKVRLPNSDKGENGESK